MKSRISVTLAVILLFIVGCNKQGSQGNTGPQGPVGTPGLPGGLPDGVMYQGTVNSNSFLVQTPGLNVALDDLVFVYACSPTNSICDQLNIYSPSLPGNVSYIIRESDSPVDIQLDNLLAINLPNYFITVIPRH